MNTALASIRNGALFALSSSICFGIVYAAITWPSAPAGETSGGKYSTRLIPTGFVGIFNLATCPTGWLPADGSNSTPDLRGQFIRGMNTFDGGAATRNDGKQDPDCAFRSGGTCSLGSWQGDVFKSHNHDIPSFGNVLNNATSIGVLPSYNAGDLAGGNGISRYPTTSNGGNESRPRNVAFLYCIKN